MSIQTSEVRKITADPMMQSRIETDPERVALYAQQLLDGAKFPPVEGLWDGERLWLWDGFHRLQAHIDAGHDTIDINMGSGTKRDAWIRSLGANAQHGHNLTVSEKRHNVARALADPDMAEKSDRQLAVICQVSHTFVANMRPKTGDEATAKARPDAAPSKAKVTKPAKAEAEPAGNVAINFQGEQVDKVAELEERNAILAEDHQRMFDRLAVAAVEATPEEKEVLAVTMAELRASLSAREAEVKVLKASRDSYMREATELKKSLGALQRKIERFEQGKPLTPAKKK